MAKDSQINPKQLRKEKSNSGSTMTESTLDGESRNTKKQVDSRQKAGDDTK